MFPEIWSIKINPKKIFQFCSTALLKPICPTLALGVVLLVKGHQAREIYSMAAVMLIYVTTKCQPNLLVSASPVFFLFVCFFDNPPPLDFVTHMETSPLPVMSRAAILTSTWHLLAIKQCEFFSSLYHGTSVRMVILT